PTAPAARCATPTRRRIAASASASAWPRIDDERVLHLIGQLAVLDGAASQPRLEHVARLFEYPARGRVPRERQRVDASEAVRLHRIAGDALQRFGQDAASPIGFTQPVADFGRHALDVGVHDEADAANRFALDRDREGGLRLAQANRADELA